MQVQPVHKASGSPKRFDFTSRYQINSKDTTTDDELDEYFNMNKYLDWESGEPIIWWAAHKAQFPRLSSLARDILSIPGT